MPPLLRPRRFASPSPSCAGGAPVFGRKRPTVSAVVVEIAEDDAPHVLRRHRPDPAGIVRVPLPVGDGDRLGKGRGDLVGRVAVEDHFGLDLGARLGALGLGDAVGGDPGDLAADDRLDLGGLDARPHRSEHREERRVAELPGDDRDREREALLDERLVEARRDAAAEDVARARRAAGVSACTRLDGSPREPDTTRPGRRGARRSGARLPAEARPCRPAGSAAGEAGIFPNSRASSSSVSVFVEVADHHRRRVVRVVEGVVELAQPLRRHLLDVAPPADRRVVVRVLAERRGERVLVEHLEGRVLAPLELVAHDRHLGHAVLVAQERAAHARGLDPDGDLELVGGDRLVVVRPVEPRRRVEPRAERLEHRGDRGALGAVELGRALEHQVLEQVRRARVAHGLVAAADVVDDGEGRRPGRRGSGAAGPRGRSS